MNPKDIVTVKCMCGNEWDFKSPITLIQTRIIRPLTEPNPTISIDVIKPANNGEGES